MIQPFSAPPRDPSSPEARAERAKTLGVCSYGALTAIPVCTEAPYAACVTTEPATKLRLCLGHAEMMDAAGQLASAVRLL